MQKIKTKNSVQPYIFLAFIGLCIIAPMFSPVAPTEQGQINGEAEILSLEEVEKTQKELEIQKQILELENQKKELESPIEEPTFSFNFGGIKAFSKEAKVEKTQEYIDHYMPNSPITGEFLVLLSEKHSFPVSFLLAVGHNESHLGTKGRAVETKNIYNVGNTDGGDHKTVKCGQYNNCLDSWKSGIEIFISLIKRCYFSGNEEIKLETWINRDFRAVRCNIVGKRYMTDPTALNKYKERIGNLKNFNIDF